MAKEMSMAVWLTVKGETAQALARRVQDPTCTRQRHHLRLLRDVEPNGPERRHGLNRRQQRVS